MHAGCQFSSYESCYYWRILFNPRFYYLQQCTAPRTCHPKRLPSNLFHLWQFFMIAIWIGMWHCLSWQVGAGFVVTAGSECKGEVLAKKWNWNVKIEAGGIHSKMTSILLVIDWANFVLFSVSIYNLMILAGGAKKFYYFQFVCMSFAVSCNLFENGCNRCWVFICVNEY